MQLQHSVTPEEKMKIPYLCFAILASISPANGAAVAAADPPWSAERIERLPQEIRQAVVSRCGPGAEAEHYFATYDNDSKVVRLDYSLLRCDRPQRLLQQTFTKSHGRYVLTGSNFEAAFEAGNSIPHPDFARQRANLYSPATKPQGHLIKAKGL
jgi:hypothetical protein